MPGVYPKYNIWAEWRGKPHHIVSSTQYEKFAKLIAARISEFTDGGCYVSAPNGDRHCFLCGLETTESVYDRRYSRSDSPFPKEEKRANDYHC